MDSDVDPPSADAVYGSGSGGGGGGGVATWLAGDVADSAAPLVLLGWSLGNGDGIIAEIHHVGEDCNVTEVSGLKLGAVRHDGFEILRILQHIKIPYLDFIWLLPCRPVCGDQQVWQIDVQPGGPWPVLEAEIRIIGLEVALVAIVELDFPGPILVLRFHCAGVPCPDLRGVLSIFEEAFHPSPYSNLRCDSNLIPSATTGAIPLRKVWRWRSVIPDLRSRRHKVFRDCTETIYVEK